MQILDPEMQFELVKSACYSAVQNTFMSDIEEQLTCEYYLNRSCTRLNYFLLSEKRKLKHYRLYHEWQGQWLERDTERRWYRQSENERIWKLYNMWAAVVIATAFETVPSLSVVRFVIKDIQRVSPVFILSIEASRKAFEKHKHIGVDIEQGAEKLVSYFDMRVSRSDNFELSEITPHGSSEYEDASENMLMELPLFDPAGIVTLDSHTIPDMVEVRTNIVVNFLGETCNVGFRNIGEKDIRINIKKVELNDREGRRFAEPEVEPVPSEIAPRELASCQIELSDSEANRFGGISISDKDALTLITEKSRGFEIMSHYGRWITTEDLGEIFWGYLIDGSLKNITSESQFAVVRAVFFNENNDIIGVHDDKIFNIEAGETSDFKFDLAHDLFPCDIAHYELYAE